MFPTEVRSARHGGKAKPDCARDSASTGTEWATVPRTDERVSQGGVSLLGRDPDSRRERCPTRPSMARCGVTP